jgi:hypothetical protein
MNRREFAGTLGLSLAGLSLGRGALTPASDRPQVAITIDDFNWFDIPQMSAEARNRALLNSLRANSIKAGLFVCARFVDNETGQKLLSAWDQEGHLIGNHTYSHRNYHDISFEQFSQDVLRGEAVISKQPGFKKFFRFPFLKEGDTTQKRDGMRQFLKANGYRNGHVTIDASDWYVDTRLRNRLKSNPGAELSPYKDYYLNHIWERSLYYDDLSRKVLGRSVKHTLLLHHNVLNGLFLGDVMEMYKRKGWKLINAEEAFSEPVFASAPNNTPAGESLIWALAKETGKFDKLLRYPAESDLYEKERMDKLNL